MVNGSMQRRFRWGSGGSTANSLLPLKGGDHSVLMNAYVDHNFLINCLNRGGWRTVAANACIRRF